MEGSGFSNIYIYVCVCVCVCVCLLMHKDKTDSMWYGRKLTLKQKEEQFPTRENKR
jgi:hypothetical protein